METTVKLRQLFDFSRIPIAIVAGLFAALTVALILMVLYSLLKDVEKKEKPVVEKQEEVFVKEDLAKLKSRYMAALAAIETEFNKDPTKIRPAYEGMSKVVREFVYKATGTEVNKLTLSEIYKNTGYSDLAKLVGEYYRPEFDKISEGDVRASLEKSRRLVSEWN